MKVLILGSNGSLGQAMAEVFAELNPICMTRADLDVTDRDQVLQKLIYSKPDVVINCTAYNLVDNAEEEPERANLINAEAVRFMAEACSKINATLVHYSTHYVFDGTKKEGYAEDDSPNPISAYAKSKLAGEQKALGCPKSYVLRTAWLYGKPGLGESSKKSFVKVMLDLVKEKNKIECVNDQFGNPTYTKDVAQATRVLIDEQKPFGVYHFVNEGEATWYTWAQEIFRVKNIAAELVPTKSVDNVLPNHKAKRPQYAILHNTKFIQFRPWQEALEEFLRS